MFSLLLHIDEEEHDAVVADLWEHGTVGVVQRYETLEAFFDDSTDRTALLTAYERWSPDIVEQPDTDWVRKTQDSFPPQLVGERFFLVPPWNGDPAPPGRFRLEINPGLACGTGWHPCTRLCLEAMEQIVRPGDRVLDVGVGSGILSAAASMLGAKCVVGCDIDPEAVWVARDVARGPLFVGSVDAVADGSFDLIVANISAETVAALMPDLDRVARRLILSGFENAPALPRPCVSSTERDGWRCVVLDRY